jgi:hypothetical protein
MSYAQVAADIAARIQRAVRTPPPSRQAAARALCAQARRLQIPIDTGRLRASLVVPGHPEQRVAVQRQPGGWSASLASTVPYAQYQIPRITGSAAQIERAALGALLPQEP